MPDRTLPKSLVLRGKGTFSPHYDRGHRETAGPIVGLALASGLPHTRVGFSVPRKVGKAHVRNRVRRLLREAFRLSQATHPAGVDLVILVRGHEPKTLAEYRAWLGRILERVAAKQARSGLPARGETPANPTA